MCSDSFGSRSRMTRPLALFLTTFVLSSCGAASASASRFEPRDGSNLMIRYEHLSRYGLRLRAARFTLDGVRILEQRFDEQRDPKPFVLDAFQGRVAPGAHTLDVELGWEAWRCCYSCGWFTPLRIRATHRFVVEDGEPKRVVVRDLSEGPLAPLEVGIRPEFAARDECGVSPPSPNPCRVSPWQAPATPLPAGPDRSTP